MIRNCFLILIAALSSSAVSFSGNATAATEKKPLPYLGPGAEKLSKEEYERIYKNYIQTSILLGYPFFKEKAPPCDQALDRKSTRLNSSHSQQSRMPSSA